MRRWLLGLVIPALLLTGCSGSTIPRLSVRTKYLTPEDLASFSVNTPDPGLVHPLIGHRLILNWNLPREYARYCDLHLQVRIRFKNCREAERKVPVTCLKGYYSFSVLDEEFCETGGIRSYYIELIGDGLRLADWSHPLWTDLIQFQEPWCPHANSQAAMTMQLNMEPQRGTEPPCKPIHCD